MIETEKKIILTYEEYLAVIMKMCKYAEPVIQTNYYFDTENLTMNRKGITCRIRFKNGKYTAEIKSHEKESRYRSIENILFRSDKFDETYFNKIGLYLQGSLVTERIPLYKDEFCEMVIDRNIYLGITDYELEIEYKENYERCAERILYVIAKLLFDDGKISSISEFLERADKSQNKSQRFFKEKNKK